MVVYSEDAYLYDVDESETAITSRKRRTRTTNCG